MLKELQLRNVVKQQTIDLAPRSRFVLESADWGIAQVGTDTIFYYPNEDNEEILSTKWNARQIQIIGYVCQPTEFEIGNACKELTEFIGVQQEIRILYQGYYLSFYPTQEVKYATDEMNDNEIFRKFQITGIATDVMWHSADNISQDSNAVLPMFFFPLWFNKTNTSDPLVPRVVFGRSYSTGDILINYDGTISRGMIFTLESASEMSGIEITVLNENDEVTQTFILNGTYPAGEIIIDTRDNLHKVTSNGNDVTSNVDPSSDWIRLYPGSWFYHVGFTSTENVNVFIEVKQNSLFEIQM